MVPRRSATWCVCLLLLLVVVQAQDVATGSGGTTTGAPSTTAPASTTPVTSTPRTTAPATTAPTPTTAAPTTATPTAAPTPTPTAAPTLTPVPITETPTTAAPATAAPATTAPSSTDSPTSTSSSPAATTAAPVVEQYNSSTLPPGIDSSMLDGAELVTVEVTETTLGDGTTSYSYVIITRSDGTEKTIVLSPTTSSDSSGGGGSDNSSPAQPDSSQSDSSKASKSMGVGAIVGIIVAAVVFMLMLFAFFIAQRRHNKHQPSDASSEDFLESPVVGKQVRLLELGQSPADTEYQEITRTTANSRSTGSSMPDGRRHRGTLWEDPVILASRIPIDRIELGAVISRGGFGVVYRGRYRDQDVAIKTLLPEKRKDLAHIQAFLSEVRLVATMEHPHIVQFIGVAWESLSDLFCVTEFMSGGDLRSLLKDYLANGVPQGMDAGKTQIAYQVAYALTYLHSLEPVVLHRDLKSRNILLTERLDAKITDFGASRIRSDATMTAGVGSSLWMAPEVMMGQRYGEKADVFSLGVVISELDTHELPYSHAKESNSNSGRPLPDTAVLQMVSMGKLRVRFSSFMDADMARFVCSCVSVEPEQRPTAAEVLYYLQVATRNRQY
ncbi:putative serine/threonine-protein kinase/receptor R831 [Phytophthora ramorum]|uniref:putative serine/threonine-protein kinase/receptor R831 n=1 Tax=Phytophthora ramorum TaxID=164328 RepID=UPI00309D2602|nr:putative serine/threonine-protein kinase/receptor R831 [Phytophthora ramorum]